MRSSSSCNLLNCSLSLYSCMSQCITTCSLEGLTCREADPYCCSDWWEEPTGWCSCVVAGFIIYVVEPSVSVWRDVRSSLLPFYSSSWLKPPSDLQFSSGRGVCETCCFCSCRTQECSVTLSFEEYLEFNASSSFSLCKYFRRDLWWSGVFLVPALKSPH
jgi:hypothetical protein